MKRAFRIAIATLAVGLAARPVASQAPDSAAVASQTATTAEAGPPAEPGPASATRRVRRSWTTDRRPLTVGDIVTIIVDEQTLATANLQEMRDKDRSRDLDLFLGLPGTSTGGSLNLRNDADERSRGEAARRERFSAEITTRVISVGDGGIAQIEGVKRLRIDDHEQAITMRGYIRAEDISMLNTIESWRVADAELFYESNGELERAPGGLLSRLFELIW